MNARLQVILFLINSSIVLGLFTLPFGGNSFFFPNWFSIAGVVLAFAGIVLTFLERLVARWVTLAAALLSVIGALVA